MNEYSAFKQRIDKSTIISAQSNDRRAMKAIYEALFAACYKLAFRLTTNKSASEDIVQNGFLKVLTKINDFEHKGSFEGWVRQIMVNEALAYLRNHKNKVVEFDSGFAVDEAGKLESSEELHSSFLDTLWWEACKDLSQITSNLNSTARAVLILHEIEGYSHKDIASFFNKTESFSKQVLARAMNKLRENVKTRSGLEK